jgi:hypothetical protein
VNDLDGVECDLLTTGPMADLQRPDSQVPASVRIDRWRRGDGENGGSSGRPGAYVLAQQPLAATSWPSSGRERHHHSAAGGS